MRVNGENERETSLVSIFQRTDHNSVSHDYGSTPPSLIISVFFHKSCLSTFFFIFWNWIIHFIQEKGITAKTKLRTDRTRQQRNVTRQTTNRPAHMLILEFIRCNTWCNTSTYLIIFLTLIFLLFLNIFYLMTEIENCFFNLSISVID